MITDPLRLIREANQRRNEATSTTPEPLRILAGRVPNNRPATAPKEK
jgi:hypothetical protein